MKLAFNLNSISHWQALASAIESAVRPALAAGQRLIVKVEPAAKSRSQEKMYHDQIGDIAEQWQYAGQTWDAEDMKRFLVAGFKFDTKNDPELKPHWDEMGDMRYGPCIRGGGLVLLGTQTRKFPKPLASAFIEWLYAFGAEVGVKFKERG